MQTTYLQEHVAGYAGDLMDSDLNKRVLPMRNNTTADIAYGRMIASDKAGTGGGNAGSDQAFRLPSLPTDVLIGATINSLAHAPGPTDSTGVNGIRANDMGDVLSQGALYVAPEQDVVPTDSVFVRFGPGTAVDGSHDATGTFRKDIDAHTAWVKKTAYAVVGARRATANGYVYALAVAGTSEDSDSGTLLAATPTVVGTIVTDGTCSWSYLGRCNSSTQASAVALPYAAWRVSGTAASGLAGLELNLP